MPLRHRKQLAYQIANATRQTMPTDRTSRMMMRSASLAVIKTVKRRRLRLFGADYRPVMCRKALPLDFTESKPFESSLDRNIEAILSECACC